MSPRGIDALMDQNTKYAMKQIRERDYSLITGPLTVFVAVPLWLWLLGNQPVIAIIILAVMLAAVFGGNTSKKN